jgi:RES domain-containing protein
VKISRRVWRHVPKGAEPLHLQWMQLARGRWNTQRPRLTCLYTALTPAGALAEYRKHFLANAFDVAPGVLAPRDLVSIDVRVEPVLDLTRPRVRAAFGVTLEQLTGDGRADLAACRRVAWNAFRLGHRAILAPSAAQEGEPTLMLYIESQHGRLTARNGPHRIPINHGPSPLLP